MMCLKTDGTCTNSTPSESTHMTLRDKLALMQFTMECEVVSGSSNSKIVPFHDRDNDVGDSQGLMWFLSSNI